MPCRYVIALADSVYGALFFAKTAADTFIFIDYVLHQALANVSGAFLIDDMRHILVSEMSERRKYGVGCRLT